MGEGRQGGAHPTSDDVRTGLSVEAFKRAWEDSLRLVLGRFPVPVAEAADRETGH